MEYENTPQNASWGIPLRDFIFLMLLFVAHSAATWVWLAQDNQPPLWDMALHQTAGINFHDFYVARLSGNSTSMDWWGITGAYPPFYHHLLAIAFLLGRDTHLAVWANLPATLALILGTYLLGVRLFSRLVGMLAAAILMGFPFMAWISRETILDYTLAATVLFAVICLDYSRGFAHRVPSLLFGLFLALAALTKWIGPLFLILPVLACWLQKVDGKSENRLRNLLDSLILSGACTLPWYLPKLPAIIGFLKTNFAVGAAEGEPPVFSFQSLIYYLRLLEGVQIQGIFFLALCMGAWYCLRRCQQQSIILFLWILSGYGALVLLRTKDPRFTLPYLPAVALLCVSWVGTVRQGIARSAVSSCIVILAIGHFLFASYGFGVLPDEIVIAKGYQGSYTWDWKLYSQNYMNILGAPVRAEWPQKEILKHVTGGLAPGKTVRLGVVPDLPRLNHENLRLEARLHRLPVEVHRISNLGISGQQLLHSMNYVVVAEGEQGMSWSTKANFRINEYIFARSRTFQIAGFARLPMGPALRIYRVLTP